MRKLKTLITLLLIASVLAGCSGRTGTPVPQDVAPAETPVSEVSAAESNAGKVVISEVMSKNRSTVRTADGSFGDWVELQNVSGQDICIDGWYLSDKENEMIQPLSGVVSDYAFFFTDGFNLSEGETVYLYDSNASLVHSCFIYRDRSDISLVLGDDGSYSESKYPTPGLPNTAASFDLFQSSRTDSGPLEINEVAVDNYNFFWTEEVGYPDWVEIKNVSDSEVSLSSYYLSDDSKDLKRYNLPDITLAPNQLTVILCDKDAGKYQGNRPIASFSLNSENEHLYLSSSEGTLVDYVSLKCIPYGKTYGRLPGENGYFYLSSPSPEAENPGGFRHVSSMPATASPDGVFNGVDSVTVELTGIGDIYYTTNSLVPTVESEKYTGPITLTETTVLRAICCEDGAMQSNVATFTYLINENHTLPVVSVVSNDKFNFKNMYTNGVKGLELPGNISYYDGNGSFNLGCGIKMHGFSSLNLPKKNLSIRFRGSYGCDELNYDIFNDGGVTEFTNLLLRGGQGQQDTIIKNEAALNLAMDFSSAVVGQRNRYCVLYIDGVYSGIYSLMEKTNEALYAHQLGVDNDDVIVNDATVYQHAEFYLDVIQYIFNTDMSDAANYEYVCSVLDIDSIIDWTIIEGWCSNYDLAEGNLRYCKSTAGDDTKWRLMLYDLDCTFLSTDYMMYNVITYPNQISEINSYLLRNPDYKDRLLSRASEAFSEYLTDERLVEEIDLLCAQIRDEVERDSGVAYMSPASWEAHIETWKELIAESDWTNTAKYRLANVCNLSEEEIYKYFG